MGPTTTVEVVALFQAEADFGHALSVLIEEGVAAERINLLASCDTVEKKLGSRYTRIADLADRADAPRVAYMPAGENDQCQHTVIGALTFVAAAFGLMLASSGGLAAMIVAATAAGGTVASVGEVLKWLVGQDHSRLHEEQLARGGLLLWVRADTAEEANSVKAVLEREGGEDVHCHSIERTNANEQES